MKIPQCPAENCTASSILTCPYCWMFFGMVAALIAAVVLAFANHP